MIESINEHQNYQEYKMQERESSYCLKMFYNGEDLIELADEGLQSYSPLCDEPISDHEVKEAIKSLEKGKATGLDDIPPDLIIAAKSQVRAHLVKIFNLILNSKTYPTEWKYDRRIPLFKSGNRLITSNFRMIAIHSVFRKLINKIFEKRIRSIIQLQDTQAGFRPKRRTSDQAFMLHDLIHTHSKSRKKDKKTMFIMGIDFSKAFDRCDFQILFKKLAQKGIRGKLLETLVDMYSDAKASIQINGSLGEPFPITAGVAQGCVLSPLFFIVYLDDLLKEFQESGMGIEVCMNFLNSLAFADDLALVALDEPMAQKFLDILERWCERNNFTVNLGKEGTGYFPITNQDENEYNLTFKGKPFKRLKLFKYLGFLISKTGSWESYFKKIIQKARGSLAQAYHFFKSEFISFSLKIAVARSMVLSTLAYGQDFINLSSSQSRQFDSILARTIRLILGQPRHSKTAALR